LWASGVALVIGVAAGSKEVLVIEAVQAQDLVVVPVTEVVEVTLDLEVVADSKVVAATLDIKEVWAPDLEVVQA
jgi:hypothetical protein